MKTWRKIEEIKKNYDHNSLLDKSREAEKKLDQELQKCQVRKDHLVHGVASAEKPSLAISLCVKSKMNCARRLKK